jgi:hypothetical protein
VRGFILLEMKTSRAIAAASFLVVAAFSIGQNASDLKPPKQISDLSWSVGKWSGSIHWTEPGTPEMDVMTTLVIDLEGQFLREKMTQEMMGLPITETAYMGWNEKEKRYDCWAFSNFAASPRIEHGTIDGKKWVFESEPWAVMGQSVVGRSTVVMVSDTDMRMTLEFKMGDNWAKVAEGTLKKEVN